MSMGNSTQKGQVDRLTGIRNSEGGPEDRQRVRDRQFKQGSLEKGSLFSSMIGDHQTDSEIT